MCSTASACFLLTVVLVCSVNGALDESIAIIGAGFSGLSTAYHLVQKGYTNIVIYEQKDRAGGYVTSVDYNDVSHDMATYAMTSAYWRFQEAMKSLGAEFCELNVDVVNTTKTPPKSVPFDDFVVEMLEAEVPKKPLLYAKFAAQAAKYIQIYNRLFKPTYVDDEMRTDRLFPLRPEPKARAELAIPMLEFIKLHELDLLTPIFVEATDSQAYGPIATTAALYYLTWVPPTLVTIPEGTIPCGTYDSMQALVDLLADSLGSGVTIKYNQDVTNVQRSDGSASASVTVGTDSPIEYDHVVVTRRLPQTGHRDALVKPELPEETGVASTLEELQIFSALMQADRSTAIPTDGFLTVDSTAMTSLDPDTEFWGILNAERRDYPKPNPYLDTATTTRVSATYYYKERAEGVRVGNSVDDKVSTIQSNLNKWDNATWTMVKNRQFGGYFQRWRPGGVLRALPWAIGGLQGTGDVYYVNSGACGFESVGHVFDCAKHLVDDHF